MRTRTFGPRSRDCPWDTAAAQLVRAVLEGVAYGLRDSLELLRELGVDARVGRVSGGGARSELWLRIVASVLGLPLELTAVEEGAAYGAALLAGVRAGVWRDPAEAVAACVRVRATVEPDPAWQAVYDDGYRAFGRSTRRSVMRRRPAAHRPHRPRELARAGGERDEHGRPAPDRQPVERAVAFRDDQHRESRLEHVAAVHTVGAEERVGLGGEERAATT